MATESDDRAETPAAVSGPDAEAVFFLATTPSFRPLYGGILVPKPVVFGLGTVKADGEVEVESRLSTRSLPRLFYAQTWLQRDGTWSATNALQLEVFLP